MLLAKLLRKILRHGTLVIISHDNRREAIAVSDEPQVTIKLTHRLTALRIIAAPNFYLAEAYVRGELVIEQGDLRSLLTIFLRSIDENKQPTPFDKVRSVVSPLLDQLRSIGATRKVGRHVQSHYDRSEKLFETFLGRTRQYSCAYFERIDDAAEGSLGSLDDAQAAKMRHIAAKLRISPRATAASSADGPAALRLLDIGSGWGGLAEFLCSTYPHLHVTGVTLSENQHRFSQAKKLPRCEFHLRDYRQDPDQYDRIVSVGMLEHVAHAHYREFFAKIESLLRPDGIALIHTIGRRGMPQPINVWIRRRIFPGAYLPSLSQLTEAIERTGLWILDCENLRMHYAETLCCWHERLIALREALDPQVYRMWEFYLVACEIGFRHQGLTVYQLLLGKHPAAVPLIRDFIHQEEQRLKAAAPAPTADRAA